MDWSLSRAISGSPAQPGPITSALMQGSPEEEYLRGLDPVTALRMTKELQNARVYSPEEATANQWQTAKDIGYSTPIVGNVMSAMDVPQGVRDVAQRSSEGDTQGARKAMIGTELSMLGTIPFAPFGGTMRRATEGAASRMNIFAGPMAKTADKEALARAQEMKAAGATRDDIWRQTGWDLDNPGGVPLFEISDHNASLSGVTSRKGHSTFTGIDHPELDAAYGKSPAIHGQYDPKYQLEGTYMADPDGVDAPYLFAQGANKEQAKQASLHEMQHHIQDIEGFPGGTSQFQARSALDEFGSPEYRQLHADVWGRKYGSGQDPEFLDALARLDKMTPSETFMAYQRHAGETQARNVEQRMHMTPEERRATPPWLTQDVPDDLQIVRSR